MSKDFIELTIWINLAKNIKKNSSPDDLSSVSFKFDFLGSILSLILKRTKP